MSFGFGASTALRQADGGQEDNPLVGLGLVLTHREGSLLLGAKGDAQGTVFGPSSSHIGVLGGFVIDLGPRSRLELTGHGGIHATSGIGDGLFVTAVRGDRSASAPYVGTRVALAWRPRQSLYVTFWMASAHDLVQQRADVQVTSCLFGCVTNAESYEVGGHEITGGIGLGWAGDGF
jgi:hypothetical protein